VKLGNWNLERASTAIRRDALRAHTDVIGADLWVLTETHRDFTPGLLHSCSSAGGRDGITGLDTPADHWVTIWSGHPLEQMETSDAIRTAAARVHPAGSAPYLVYGTVLPWNGDNWRGYASAGGVAFCEALKVQRADWLSLRQRFPNDELFVMGDFNQDLAPTHYYGSRLKRNALVDALDECGLVALTLGEGDPIRREAAPLACIDHICALRDSKWISEPAIRWPATQKPAANLSDHFGLAVNFTPGY
jgi:hypothetical protein